MALDVDDLDALQAPVAGVRVRHVDRRLSEGLVEDAVLARVGGDGLIRGEPQIGVRPILSGLLALVVVPWGELCLVHI